MINWRNTQVGWRDWSWKPGGHASGAGVRIPFPPPFIFSFIAGWSSPVARWAHNPEVRGSNPLPATIFIIGLMVQLVNTSACHAEDRGFESRWDRHFYWLHSSVGRARDWKSLCRWFDSTRSHHLLLFALIAQLDRAFGYGPKGYGFDSYWAHH